MHFVFIRNKKAIRLRINGKIIIPLLLLPVWYMVYHYLQPAADWLIDLVPGLVKRFKTD